MCLGLASSGGRDGGKGGLKDIIAKTTATLARSSWLLPILCDFCL